jgi:hypothetical protein
MEVGAAADDGPDSPSVNLERESTATAGASAISSVRWTSSADPYGIGALTFYFILSVLFFGRALPGHLSDYHVGVDIPADSTIFIWSLAWWRHALLNRVNPLLTTAIWAPTGINLAWVTTAPLAAFVAIPATDAFGPVATCNVLFILSPALSAWTAFLLCRRISNSYSSAIVGGYIFGFSAYMLGQMQGHLHQLLAFPVPLAVYLVVRSYQGNIRTGAFILSIALTLAAEFLIALEVFATLTIFGLLAIALALGLSPNDIRKRISRVLVTLSLGYAIAIVIVSPFIYYLFAPGNPHWGSMYSADPIGFLIPTTYFELGKLSFLKAIASRFPFDSFESDTYFGPVLIAIVALYGRRHWHEPFARMMIDTLIIIGVLSLGPILHVMGRNLAAMPGAIITSLPLMSKATPARFAMYAFLILAVVSSIWLTELSCAPIVRAAIVGLLVLTTLPNLSANYWVRPTNTPAFFTSGSYRKYISPRETIIALPYWMLGNGMLWQAQTDMYFRMAGAWTGPPPPEFDRWPIVKALATNMLPPEPDLQFKGFVANHNVDAVIVGAGTDPVFQPMLSSLDNAPTSIGGVTIYRASADALKPYHQLTALEMETRADSERFDTLVVAANRYLADGHRLSALSPSTANRLGLIPVGWVHNGTVLAFNALWLGPWEDDGVSIGITGSFAALKPLIERYRSYSTRIYFPFPAKFRDHAIVPQGSYVFMVMFDRGGLAHAAAKVASTPTVAALPRSTR